jgi:Tol biopolymer transport system component
MPGGYAQVEYMGHDFDVYEMRANGTGVRRVTHDFSDAWPVVSPDGKTIAYFRSSDASDNGELELIDSNGKHERELATAPDGPPSWSPDGRLLAFTRAEGGDSIADDLWVVPSRGGRPRRLARNVDTFTWSRRGSRIAVGSGRVLSLIDARSGRVERLARVAGPVSDESWSPDDRRIVFVDGYGYAAGDNTLGAWVVDVDGSGLRPIPGFDKDVDTIDWLPHHRATLLLTTLDGDAYLMRPDGSDEHPLPFLTADGVAVSPSGERILFEAAVYHGETDYHETLDVFDLATRSVTQLTQTRIGRG